jgi:hypothetical protein
MRKLKRDYTFALSLSLARIDYRKEKELLAFSLSLSLSFIQQIINERKRRVMGY